VYLRDTTMITAYPLLLFGGDIQVQAHAGTVTIDDWALSCPPKAAVLFKQLRDQLEKMLLDKIERPTLDLWQSGGPVLETIIQLINTEKA
jgi:hypothetical protein